MLLHHNPHVSPQAGHRVALIYKPGWPNDQGETCVRIWYMYTIHILYAIWKMHIHVRLWMDYLGRVGCNERKREHGKKQKQNQETLIIVNSKLNIEIQSIIMKL